MASCSLAQKNYSTAVRIDQDKLKEFSAQQTDKLFENMKQSDNDKELARTSLQNQKCVGNETKRNAVCCTSGVRTHSGLFLNSALDVPYSFLPTLRIIARSPSSSRSNIFLSFLCFCQVVIRYTIRGLTPSTRKLFLFSSRPHWLQKLVSSSVATGVLFPSAQRPERESDKSPQGLIVNGALRLLPQ